MTAPVPDAEEGEEEEPTLPPWTWSNLSEPDARDLDAAVQFWVTDYNRHLAVISDHIIPACWRQHPSLTQELPIQYYGWLAVHREPKATALEALEYYTKYLPSFRDRLNDLLPDHGPCRAGAHKPPSDSMGRLITRAESDVAARGPDVIDVLRRTTFGPSAAAP